MATRQSGHNARGAGLLGSGTFPNGPRGGIRVFDNGAIDVRLTKRDLLYDAVLTVNAGLRRVLM